MSIHPAFYPGRLPLPLDDVRLASLRRDFQ